jgi:signal transduction histidine kinase
MKLTQTILGVLSHPVLVLDDTFKPLFANPAFYALFDLPPEGLKKKDFIEFVSGGSCAPPLQGIIESILCNDACNGEVAAVYTLPAGKRLFLLINARRVPAANAPEMIVVEFNDVSEANAAELLGKELNNRLRSHSDTLDAVNEELESYSHSVSHDLRMPLRFVNRIAHLLLHGPGEPLSDTAANQVSMILQATTEMGKLIENLLVFSQANQSALTMRRVNLERLCHEAVKELQQYTNNNMVDIVIQKLTPCRGNRVLLKAVLVNLLENALKFSRKDEWARISVGCNVVADETVYFVKDNGIGFDMKEAEALFIPFHRLHKQTDFGGVGLGLSLAQRVVERHGGRIWCESVIDEGTIFYFTLGDGGGGAE